MIETLIIALVNLVGWKAAAGVVLFIPLAIPALAFSIFGQGEA